MAHRRAVQQRFSPAAEDIDAVTGWLQSHGFTVNVIYPRSIDFSGTAGQVRDAFRTEIHHLDVNGAAHIANMSDPEIPAALAPVVAGVFALNDFMPRPHAPPARRIHVGRRRIRRWCQPTWPPSITSIRSSPRSNSGQGQTIVVVEDSDVYSTADWSTFRSTLGLSTYTSGRSPRSIRPPERQQQLPRPRRQRRRRRSHPRRGVGERGGAQRDHRAGLLQRHATNFGGFIALQNLINASDHAASDREHQLRRRASRTWVRRATPPSTPCTSRPWPRASPSLSSAGDEGAASCGRRRLERHARNRRQRIRVHPIQRRGRRHRFRRHVRRQRTARTGARQTPPITGPPISYIPEIPWNDSCASALIASFLNFESSSRLRGILQQHERSRIS